jgi:hypothetical protein
MREAVFLVRSQADDLLARLDRLLEPGRPRSRRRRGAA